ncbi:MAG: subunit of tubulin prefoldin [Piccolia ochrophora]|nr:MAG: subunit of tubulin prefoldin [Piccolia ochrophora]
MAQPQQIDLTTLTNPQLTTLKSRLDAELEHLTTSFQKLRAAQAKFRECVRAVGSVGASRVGGREVQSTGGKPILVPLTSSLYVPGTLADTKNVIVDVGTGFYVEKSTADATTFYNGKVDELGTNLKDLEAIVQGKSNNLRVVEEVLRQRVISGNSVNEASATAAVQQAGQ